MNRQQRRHPGLILLNTFHVGVRQSKEIGKVEKNFKNSRKNKGFKRKF